MTEICMSEHVSTKFLDVTTEMATIDRKNDAAGVSVGVRAGEGVEVEVEKGEEMMIVIADNDFFWRFYLLSEEFVFQEEYVKISCSPELSRFCM